MTLGHVIAFIQNKFRIINTKDYLKIKLKRKRFYSLKVSVEVLVGIIVWFYLCNLKNFKQYYIKFIRFFYKLNLCYSRLMFWKSELNSIIEDILNSILSNSRDLMIDSTSLPMTKSYLFKQYKSLRKEISKGYSTTGQFYGFKLYLVIDFQGVLKNFYLTQAKEHDLTVFKSQFLNPLLKESYSEDVLILADLGYRNKILHDEFKTQGIFFELKNPKRWLIESLINHLKKQLLS